MFEILPFSIIKKIIHSYLFLKRVLHIVNFMKCHLYLKYYLFTFVTLNIIQ